MGFSVMNSETGEVDLIPCDYNRVQEQRIDQETGEPMEDNLKVRYVKHQNFQIPKKFIRYTACEEFDNAITGEYRESSQFQTIRAETKIDGQVTNEDMEIKNKKSKEYNTEYYMNMIGVNSDIILGYHKNNIHLFLLPTIFFFNVYTGMLLFFFEAMLHCWSHCKNILNSNKNIYYRSPMHILTSQFCARCRAEAEVDLKLFEMLSKQMRQARKSQTLKNMTKALS